MDLPPLPVDEVLADLTAALRTSASLVLRAPPGAGKTTRVPPALLDAGLAEGGRIVVLQPRRLAARAAARRMAGERGANVGGEIGYQVRFDNRTSESTRIVAATYGVLLRQLQDDALLENTAIVIFDEFHERALDADLSLGMVRRLQQTLRPELKIVVMSATMAPAPIAAYLDDCPIVESQGRQYPVEIDHLRDISRRPLAELVGEGVEQAIARTTGDVLVFLPGLREIRDAARILRPLAQQQNLAVMELYGDMPPAAQDAVLAPLPQRKVVLATNVAETSVTIEGVTAVVDSGLARKLMFEASVGLDRLMLGPISQAAAEQRAGRAGRTQPGWCLRLWPQAAHRARPAYETPEIGRVDLAAALLQIMCWEEPDVTRFPWFEPPPEEAIQHAAALLEQLGAAAHSAATPLGRRIARLPVHPRIGRLLIEAERFGAVERAALAAALLTERDPFVRLQDRNAAAQYHTDSDVLDRVHALEEFEAGGRLDFALGRLNRGAARYVLRIRDQLGRLMESQQKRSRRSNIPSDEVVMRALLAAFPDRLARRREPGSRRAVMVGGRGIRLAPQSALSGDAELFVCVDVDGQQAEALVRQASTVQRDWLPAEEVRETVECFFDSQARQVRARRRTYWFDLLLEEAQAPLPDRGQVAAVLAEAAAAHFEQVRPPNDSAAGELLVRIACLGDWMPELKLPSFDESFLRELLPALCAGRRSFAELRDAPWLPHVQEALSYEQLQSINRHAPREITIPSGRQAALRYEAGRPPVLAVRIQEMFGLRQTPRIAGGRVAVLLHLLAPNMRPQQVTDDLESFWANTYPQVRKDLRGRYPKHAWPEDPTTAEPLRGAKKRN